jgi:hypothetical protein
MGTRAVMGEWGERKKTHLLCFLVSVSGAVGMDVVGQVAGWWSRLQGTWTKAKKKSKFTIFFLVSISGAVGTDAMGQVVGVVVG